MIYLLQDCYKDDNGNYNDVLKIGYSKEEFSKIRQSHYSTHNYGYKLLGEKDGSLELENYIHKILKDYNLSHEWFKYDQEVINKFWETSENDISEYTSQDDLNNYIRDYILKELVSTTEVFKDLYLEKILNEIKDQDPEYEDNKNDYKREILKIFEFVSSREREYFTNLDFNSEETIKTLEDCDLIVGRQRNRNNPFKNKIVIFYKTIRGENVENVLEFNEKQEQRKRATKDLLDFYEKGTPSQQKEYIKKLQSDIKVSKYENDFVSISKKTGEPVYNSLIEIANERAWEVSQVDYQDKITVTKSILKQGYNSCPYNDEDDLIVLDFLDNHFYKTNIFEEKMKMYCEFMDTYKNNLYIFTAIIHKVDPKFKTYYDIYGTSGCRAVSFHEIYLKTKISNTFKSSDLREKLISYFKIQSKYELKTIKLTLKSVYSDLGITKTPKASDLETYFDTKIVLITDESTGKRNKGYLILGIK